jgi:hypothetical protein
MLVACKSKDTVPELNVPESIAADETNSIAPEEDQDLQKSPQAEVSASSSEEQILKIQRELEAAQASGKATEAELSALKLALEEAQKNAAAAVAQSKALEDQLKKAQTASNTPASTTTIEKAKVAFIFQHNSQYCLDMEGDKVTNSTSIQLFKCGDTPSQWYDLHKLRNGMYHIVRNNYAKGRPDTYQCLNVAQKSLNNGANIETYACDGSDSQTFQMVDQGAGIFMLRNLRSGKCLEAQNNGASDGVKIIQFDCLGNAQQKLTSQQR